MRTSRLQNGIKARFGAREQRGELAKAAARRGLGCEHSREERNVSDSAWNLVWADLFACLQAWEGVQALYAHTKAFEAAP